MGIIFLLLLGIGCRTVSASTWYVRIDGGTRYSVNATKGQCDGTADAPYPGKGVNRHCAFKDVRYLWTDGSYTVSPAAPAWGWIGAGGDTYIIRGSIADGVSYRIGQNGPKASDWMGLAGNPYAAGAPVPPSGSAAAHTRILGGNYGACSAPSARTQLHGGYAVGSVLDMRGASYVDLACLDITDFSSCGRAAQANGCNSDLGSLSDYATNGIAWSGESTHDTLTDVRIHGLASAGMIGPTGDDVVMTDIDLVGNASSGWNADAGNGKTGWGKLQVRHFNISWNGCAEEYPIAHPLPYTDCTDDNRGGYGDGFGTATLESHPGWQVRFDQGVVSYNTQDGLDALHLTGAGSSMTVTHTLAFGNMGQQLKIGGSSGDIEDSRIFTNCNALRQNIPGTPAGYNRNLSDFCRAADTGVVLSVNDGSTAVYARNLLYSASATALQIVVNGSCNTGTCLIRQEHNVFIGFRNDAADGYPGGGDGEYSNPIYVEDGARAYRNAGSSFSHNTTFHAKNNWPCPNTSLHETNAHCGDPHLGDETWHLYGYADVQLPSNAAAAENPSPPDPSHTGHVPAVVVGTITLASVAAATWAGMRARRS